jgi:hypothetical protein
VTRLAAPGGRTGRPAAVVALVAAALAAGGCAYYNGVYNAKASAGRGDKLVRRGRVGEASAAYDTAAAKAETVLARYPHSRWRADALYVAGRSQAILGRCAEAVPRLTELLAARGGSGERRDRAELALASCEVRGERFADARSRLEPLLHAPDEEVASQAAILAARAALALGANDEAARHLRAVPAGAAQWELAAASLERREYARAESLFALRARSGDYRDDVLASLRELWAARRADGVERIVAAYGAARTPSAGKIALHVLAADLLASAGRDSAARAHLHRAQGLAADTLSARDVAARLCRLDLASASASADAEAIVARAHGRAAGSPIYERLRDNLLWVKLLEQRSDFSGVSLFLAGEVARDSLRAPLLAHAIFTRVASTMPLMPIAPKALLAAAATRPDSAAAYRELVRTRYAQSPYALLLDGADPSDSPQYQTVEEGLRRGWDSGVALLADTLGKLRPVATSASPATGAPPAASGAAGTPAVVGTPAAAGTPTTAGTPAAAGTASTPGGTPAASPRDSAAGRQGAAPGGRP